MENTPKISGFTFVRNAVKFDYPVIESITSILPVCDELIVNVGNSEDSTLDLIRSIRSDKIRIVESVWDDNKREGGAVLAQQTDIALSHCTGDWCFYIQADEVVHEKYLDPIKQSMHEHFDNPKVEGLLFKYLHFYGSYEYIGSSRRWYRNEIRVIRNRIGVNSYKDAQGFRINDRKLNVKRTDAYIYHYGWVKDPVTQQRKQHSFNRLWHPDSWVKKNVGDSREYDYSNIDALNRFDEDHPYLMKNRVSNQDWEFKFDPNIGIQNAPLKHKILNILENITGYRFGEYKNYRVI
ncbi:glycosyltransferase family 2 protein [candidate division KSB1 bacterium]